MAKAKNRKSSAAPGGVQRDNGLIAIGAVTVAVIVLIIVLIALNQTGSQIDLSAVSVDYPVGVTEDGQPFKGDANAPILLEEFADFRCPHCASFYQETKALDDYIQNGQVKLVFLNYPVLGQASATAAQAVECALEQGPAAFWLYHDTLFENQNLGESLFNRNALKDLAGEVGLNQGDFDDCLNANQTRLAVESDVTDGSGRGVTGTPSLFINGERHNGSPDAASLSAAFDELLQ